MNSGVPPTLLKARTGELTPPGDDVLSVFEKGSAAVHTVSGFGGSLDV